MAQEVIINGQPLEFKPGESVIELATRNHIDIPFYCWHPRLSVAANCRMCLVDIEKSPKLTPACQTPCKEGMVVHTNNDKVKAAQRAISEFLLINHPIDCPICDQAGECKLQDYYMKYQLAPSRMSDVKVHKTRLTPLGPHVMYNAERCIVCTRCVRFMDEVPKNRQLGVFNRGDHAVIGTVDGLPLDDPYSLNTVDVCPVGALTSRVFRFKQRVWNLKRTPSVCPGCARGCNVHVDQRAGQVYRLLPRENEQVNQSWMCDEGRLTYSWANENRLETALMKQTGGDALVVDNAEALQYAVALLRQAVHGSERLAVVVSLHATCEEVYVLGRVLQALFGSVTVALLAETPGEADNLLRVADKNPNRAGVEQVLRALGFEITGITELCEAMRVQAVQALLCIGHQGLENATLAKLGANLPAMVHLAAATSPLSAAAHVTLPIPAWVAVDGSWINVDGYVQALQPAYAPPGSDTGQGQQPTHVWLLSIAKALGAELSWPSVAAIQADLANLLPTFAQAFAVSEPIQTEAYGKEVGVV